MLYVFHKFQTTNDDPPSSLGVFYDENFFPMSSQLIFFLAYKTFRFGFQNITKRILCSIGALALPWAERGQRNKVRTNCFLGSDNFPITGPGRRRSVGWSCHISVKWKEVTLPCSWFELNDDHSCTTLNLVLRNLP